jgi:hypothetical protein
MAPCTPPLKVVSNGPGGAPLVAMLDPDDIPQVDTNPGFGDLANSILGDAGSDADGFDAATADAAAGIDAIDTVATAMDAVLDTILTALDLATDQTIDPAYNILDADQPTGDQLIAAVNPGTLADVGALPFTTPTGEPVGSQPGGTGPAQLHAGDPQQVVVFTVNDYQFWLQMQYNIIHLVGPNPPFVQAQNWQRGPDPNNPITTVDILVNPVSPGTYDADLNLTQFQLPITSSPKVLGTYTARISFTVLP